MSKRKYTFNGIAGQPETLKLRENPYTGRQWFHDNPQGLEISRSFGMASFNDPSVATFGTSGHATFTMTPERDGQYEVNFELRQPTPADKVQ
jgi:predicted secreted protein